MGVLGLLYVQIHSDTTPNELDAVSLDQRETDSPGKARWIGKNTSVC